MEDLSLLSNDELQKKAFHIIDVKKLQEYVNPLGCWAELESPITKKEVLVCLLNNDEKLTYTPLHYENAFAKENLSKEECRKRHIQKIAFFIKNDFSDPISLDVGIPELNAYVSYYVDDGNHRLAASILKGKESVNAHIQGSVEYAKELGLWSPNAYQEELDKRYLVDYEKNRLEQEKRDDELSKKIIASFSKKFKP